VGALTAEIEAVVDRVLDSVSHVVRSLNCTILEGKVDCVVQVDHRALFHLLSGGSPD